VDVGVVLQTNPPAARVVELARQAEMYGFSNVWTFDSHLLWQEPYVIYSAILAATRRRRAAFSAPEVCGQSPTAKARLAAMTAASTSVSLAL